VLQDEEEKTKHAFILSYITHLVNFFKLAASSRRSKSRDNIYGEAINKYKIPRIVYQKFSSLFLDPASNVLSTDKKELIIGYILVLTLFADSFCSDPSDIAKDLGMTLSELRLYFMQLGCKLSTDSRSGIHRTKYLWTLRVPLKSADLTKKKKFRRGWFNKLFLRLSDDHAAI